MYDEPKEDPADHVMDPAARAREKANELRIHAEIAAVFEGNRKFGAEFLTRLDADMAREVQRTMARLEKSKDPASPVLPPPSVADATALLNFPDTRGLSTNDYHIHRRPGEVMILRWLAGPQIETFYERLQAHFDAALEGFREDEREAQGWKQDPKTLAFLEAMDKVKMNLADMHLRKEIKAHNLFVLSTQTADEMNIAYLCDQIMGVHAAEIVGPASAPPPDEPTEQERAWFYKLFLLRGIVDGIEKMCFFAFLQKSDDNEW